MTDALTSAQAVPQAAEGAPPSRLRRGMVILVAVCMLVVGMALALGVVSVKPIVTGHDVGSWFL